MGLNSLLNEVMNELLNIIELFQWIIFFCNRYSTISNQYTYLKLTMYPKLFKSEKIMRIPGLTLSRIF